MGIKIRVFIFKINLKLCFFLLKKTKDPSVFDVFIDKKKPHFDNRNEAFLYYKLRIYQRSGNFKSFPNVCAIV
jgi:hypothetical protein